MGPNLTCVSSYGKNVIPPNILKSMAVQTNDQNDVTESGFACVSEFKGCKPLFQHHPPPPPKKNTIDIPACFELS